MRSLDYRLSPPGTPRLTPVQVAVVLHALADHTALEEARVYDRRETRYAPDQPSRDDPYWPTTTSIGRWLHSTADALENR